MGDGCHMIENYGDCLKGWYRAYCYIFQQASNEAYIHIPDVVVYDEESGEVRHRHFLGFKGFYNQDPEGYYLPATYPVFASHQPSFSSQSVVSSNPIELHFEWCDDEWRNGQRLVEALCGPNWSDYAMGCEEEAIAADPVELYEWIHDLDVRLQHCPDFDFDDTARSLLHFPNIPDDIDEIDFTCADNGRIDSLVSLCPDYGLIEAEEVTRKGWQMKSRHPEELADYGLIVVGPPLVYEKQRTEIHAVFGKQLEDTDSESVKEDNPSKAGSAYYLGTLNEADKRNPDVFGKTIDVCRKKSSTWAWDQEIRDAEKRENDFLEIYLLDVKGIYQEEHGTARAEVSRHVVRNKRPLARIPIAHYKNDRNIMQWKKAIDLRGDEE